MADSGVLLLNAQGLKFGPGQAEDRFFFDGHMLRFQVYGVSTETTAAFRVERMDPTNNAPTTIFAVNKDGSWTFGGPQLIVDGTVTAPGLAFANETNTGIYRGTSGEIDFTVLGVRRASINANNQVLSAAGLAGTPGFSFLTDTTSGMFLSAAGQVEISVSGRDGIRFTDIGVGAVNFLLTQNAVTGNAPGIRAGGADANVTLNLSSKGTSGIAFLNNAFSNTMAQILGGASVVNYVNLTSTATGINPSIAVAGADTNVGFDLQSKGNGSVRILTNSGAQLQFQVSHTASAVNYIQATGSPTTGGVVLSAQGSDASIELRLSSKGSNPVTLYTGAGLGLLVANIASTVNYFQIQGAATGAGIIMSAQGSDASVGMLLDGKGSGGFVALRPNGLTALATAGVASAVNYVQVTNAATGVAPIVDALGSDTNINLRMRAKGSGAVEIMSNSADVLVAAGVASAVNYAQVNNAATGNGPQIFVTGGDASVQMNYSTKGGGSHAFYSGAFGQINFQIDHVASAVNRIAVAGGATGASPTITSIGSDTNIGFTISSKGTGTVYIRTGGNARTVAEFLDVASSVNFLGIQGGATGVGPAIQSLGSDTNVQLTLTSKGTGTIFIQSGSGARNIAQFVDVASSVNYIQIAGGATGTAALISSAGTDTNVPLTLSSKGTSPVEIDTGAFARTVAQFRNVASSVNYHTFEPSATGAVVVHAAAGSDAAVILSVRGKGSTLNGSEVFIADTFGTWLAVSSPAANITGLYSFSATAAANTDIAIVSGGTGVVRLGGYSPTGATFTRNGTQYGNTNHITVTPSGTGVAPIVGVDGNDANINHGLGIKGTGVVDFRYATVALGGGAAPTFGTIGGSGPATAAQNSWLKVKINGTDSFIPIWR